MSRAHRGAAHRYRDELARSGLAPLTQRAYARHVERYLEWLASQPEHSSALVDASARDFAVRDWRRALKADRLAPATLNNALAGVDDLYRRLGLGPARGVRREAEVVSAPRALSEAQLRRLLRALCGRTRDRAVVALAGFAGLRVAEIAALRVDDVAMSARTGKVIVWRGKGDRHREVPLPAEARTALTAWLRVRPNVGEALFPGSAGGHLTDRSLRRSLVAVGRAVGLRLSPHTLRHTYVTRLVRQGVDLPTVAELAGHCRLETTRRYARPSEEDRQAAVELLELDY